jgi:hypothetical protein
MTGLLPVLFLAVAATLELGVGETSRVPDTQASVTFVRVVDDSRCPKGVQCMWAGDATIEVRVTSGGEPELVQLHLNASDVLAKGLHLTLQRLDPYPENGRPINDRDYRAALAITHE